MTWPQLRALADQVRTVPLEAVLRLSGAQPDRYDPHKWHTSCGVLSVTAAKFMKALNGHFDFASAPKQGTTATLTLPIGPRATTITSP